MMAWLKFRFNVCLGNQLDYDFNVQSKSLKAFTKCGNTYNDSNILIEIL